MNVDIERVLAAAQSWDGLHEEGGENKGQIPATCLAECSITDPEPWCAALVRRIGRTALWDEVHKTTRWPVIANASCKALGQWAEHRGVLVDKPARGHVFLLWESSLGRFGHTGFVLLEDTPAAPGHALTFEGNTNTDGSREGWKACYKHRLWGPHDRFINWAALMPVSPA
jgi:hypothetical protein